MLLRYERLPNHYFKCGMIRASGPFRKINHHDRKGIWLPAKSNGRRDDVERVGVAMYTPIPLLGLGETKTCQGNEGSLVIDGRKVGGRSSIDAPMVEAPKPMDEENGDIVANIMALAIDSMAANDDNLVIDERVSGPGPLPNAGELENYGLRREIGIGLGPTKQKSQKESLETY
ncbi:hypothetical protein Q3G72_022323 [Acer saccharum]|nr:hypothetical protein Q3G72_022323 [Acer saccharum]